MAKATTASKAAKHVPKKRAREGVSDRGAPKKGLTDKFCTRCKAVDGPFTTHNTTSVVGSTRTAAKGQAD